VSGAHLPDHAKLRQIAAEVFGDASYRHEPLETVSLVYTNAVRGQSGPLEPFAPFACELGTTSQ